MNRETAHHVAIPLTDEQIEALVEKVSERVIQNFYMNVGETVIHRLFWVVGIAATALFAWLAGSGKLPTGH